MHTNESTIDRIVRAIAAVALLAGAWLAGFGTVLGVSLAVVAGILLVTAAVGFCPIYGILGLSTHKPSHHR